MGTITTSGVGSGLDIEGIVTKLVQTEGSARQTQFQLQQASAQAKISAYGQLRSALAQLQNSVGSLKDTAVFRSRSASVANADALAVSAGPTAAPGTYNVEVVRLATGAKLASGPVATSATAIGTGTLTLATNGKSFSLTIGDSNGTLAGIRDAINGAKDNPGISATIVTANDGARLVLTTAATGAASAITVTQTGGDGGLAQLAYDPANGLQNLSVLQTAQDARIIVDDYTYDSPSNTITAALDGVSLTLKKETGAGVKTAVTVSLDNSRATAGIAAFVNSYNQVVNGLRSMGAYDAAKQQGGPLLGDSLLRGALGSIRSLLGSTAAGLAGNPYTSLSDVGITTNLDGTLKLETAKLSTAMTSNAAAVERLFTDDAGFARKLDSLVSGYVKTGGLIDSRTGGLQSTLKDIGRRQEQLQISLAAYEKRLRAQFTAMDTLVASMKQTGQNLVSQLSSIDPNYYGNN